MTKISFIDFFLPIKYIDGDFIRGFEDFLHSKLWNLALN